MTPRPRLGECKLAHAVVVRQELDRDDPPVECRDCVYRLTITQRRILKLIAQGLTTRQMADYLCVTIKTIESHRQAISRILGYRSVALQTKYAIQKGLTTVDFEVVRNA